MTFQGNYNQEPAWSPKGDLIAFSGRDEHRVFDLYTVAVDGGKVTRLTQNQGTNEKPGVGAERQVRALLLDTQREAADLDDPAGRIQPPAGHFGEAGSFRSCVGTAAEVILGFRV